MTKLYQNLIVAAITAMISILATLAMAGDVGLPRAEVERLIANSEQRTDSTIQEMKASQREILTRVQQIQIDVAKLSAERNGR